MYARCPCMRKHQSTPPPPRRSRGSRGPPRRRGTRRRTPRARPSTRSARNSDTPAPSPRPGLGGAGADPRASSPPGLLGEAHRPQERPIPYAVGAEAPAERLALPRGHGPAQAELLLVDRHGQLVIGLGGVVLANRGLSGGSPSRALLIASQSILRCRHS